MSMRTTKIAIKNLFGISEKTLDGKSIELSGPKGSGKTSVLDAIRFALTNRSDRDYIIRQGADEGEILIETDTGLSIDRKTRTAKADAVKVKDGKMLQTRPAEFLQGIFTPLQLNPVDFCQLPRQEKNRVILSLVDFPWDTNWIQERFGEIPQGVDYSKHILEVLADIQSESGVYFQSRQGINRDIRNKQAFISDIAKTLPDSYDYAHWNEYSLGDNYRELERRKENNATIERAKVFQSNYESELRGLQGSRDTAIATAEKIIANDREQLLSTVERLKAEIKAAEDKIAGLADNLSGKIETIEARYNESVAKLEKNMGTAAKYATSEPEPVAELSEEVTLAEAMKKHLNEYKRMQSMQNEIKALSEQSAELTRKIELARELPAEILAEATIPVGGLTVKDGIPLINDLPISNLSDGELLELCVDISVCRPGRLEIILIDGAEKLDTESREKLYSKCKEKGLQLIATRVTDSDELEVIELE